METNKMGHVFQKYDQKRKTDPCIWMQAGVIPLKLCKNEYRCAACNFDMEMRRIADENEKHRQQGTPLSGKKGKIVHWQEKLKELPAWKRPCIHHMKRRIQFRACSNEYKCYDCEFDQFFHDQYAVHAVVKPVDVLDIESFKVPQGYYVHKGHAWLKMEENSEVRIGIDDFAMRLLGPFDRIEGPLVGKEVEQGKPQITMIRGQNRAQLLSPVSGVVTAINPDLREKASLADSDTYAGGWIMRVYSNRLRQDVKNLMIGEEAGSYFKKQVDLLHNVIEEEAGPLAADGGYLGDDIFGKLPQLKWNKLTKLFLHT
jgi:glycine cleavage system H lipoate-binding protein